MDLLENKFNLNTFRIGGRELGCVLAKRLRGETELVLEQVGCAALCSMLPDALADNTELKRLRLPLCTLSGSEVAAMAELLQDHQQLVALCSIDLDAPVALSPAAASTLVKANLEINTIANV